MRTAFAALAAALGIGLAAPALAADATGVIKEMDKPRGMVTLDSGAVYTAKGVSLQNLKVGQRVTVTYSQSGRNLEATAVKPAM